MLSTGVSSRAWLPPNSTFSILIRILSRPSPDTALTTEGVRLPGGWVMQDHHGMLGYTYTADAAGMVLQFPAQATLPLRLVAGTVPGEVTIAVQVDDNNAIPETNEDDNVVVGTLTLVRTPDVM